MNEKAKDAALTYLGPRDRTGKEVAEHLKNKGFEPEDIAPVIAYLKDLRYIDDEDFARRFFHMSLEKGRGPMRIRRDLTEKGISSETIQILMEENLDREQELDRALELGRKKAGENPDEKALARTGRFLASRGFSASVVYGVLAKLRSEGSEEGEMDWNS